MKKYVVLLASLSLIACTSTTVIRSQPEGAKVYLGDEMVGQTPYVYSDNKIIGTTNQLTLKKEGYEDFTTSFSRNEQVNVGALIAGIFVLVPFLWVMDYKPTHSYEMTQLQGDMPAQHE